MFRQSNAGGRAISEGWDDYTSFTASKAAEGDDDPIWLTYQDPAAVVAATLPSENWKASV